MMNRIATLIFVFSSFFAIAQNRASVTANSDFKTINNGVIESTFVFDQDLTEQQLESFSTWTTQNKAIGTFSLVSKTLTTSFTVDGNNRHVYEKMFYLLGLDVFDVVVNGQKKPMDKDAFFAHFNL